MIKITETVEVEFLQDDIALVAARTGILNISAYARSLQPRVESRLQKAVQTSSIVTALSRIISQLDAVPADPTHVVQSLAVHSHLEGMTYERTAKVSAAIRDIYQKSNIDDNTFMTVTQGINEVTIVTEERIAKICREKLRHARQYYDKTNLVGITVKLKVGNLEVPNLIFAVTRRLAYKRINIIEVVSTATELTYILERADLAVALEQLQKEV